MSHLIVVNVDFAGNVASKFPVYIVGDRLFCTDVLDAVSSELEDNDKFVFKDKLLDKGLGFDFGKVTNDEENVYMIMAKLNDNLKPVLVGDAKLSSPYGNKTELLFTRISTDKLLSDYQKTPTDCLKPVASNFLTYIENAITTAPSTISIEDLRAGAELALAVGENAEKDGDQVESIREYTRYAHFLCCMDKESRDAYIQGNEQHVIESVIKGNCDKYFSGLYDLGWSNTNRTMLGYAAEKGALNIVKWLIEGCPEKYKTAVDELVPDGKKNSSGEAGKTPLYWAAKGGHLKVCQYLVSKGADVNRKFYDYKKASKKIEEIDELVDKNEITNEVRTYIKAERDLFKVRDRWWRWCGSVPSDATGEKIRQWIKAGVSPDSYLGRHWNLLSWAVALRDINLVTFLISYGADVKGKYSACPSDGYTALMLACEEGDTNLVKELIFKGVDLYVQQEDDLTAFHYAIKCKQYECAQMLLDNGLDVTNCPSVKIDGVLIDPQKFAEEFPTIKSLCANARQGDADSQNELGYYYSKGIGVYKDWGEAVKWFRKAAAQDHAVAHYNLYLCHSTGMGGVKKDKIEAEKHRKKAEELGYHTN